MNLVLPVSLTLPAEGPLHIAATLYRPETPAEPSIALVCLPGGGMNRRYFDLRAEGDDSFSFAREMQSRGFIVITMDHLGIGESSRPADGYALDTDVIARANAEALQHILEGLRSGAYGTPCAPLTVGVGHSMGAMMTLVQQAQHHQHAAIVLMGFSTRGLPQYAPPEVAALAGDPIKLREAAATMARRIFREPYPRVQGNSQSRSIFGGNAADPRGVAALKVASGEPLLPVGAAHSMLPDNVASEAAAIDVPVYLALGERDMAGPPHEAPAAFKASREVALQVLDSTGHAHFLFAARRRLFEHLAIWTRYVVAA